MRERAAVTLNASRHAGQRQRHPAAGTLRHAVCVTGLEREYSEISANIRRAVFGLLNRTAVHTDVRVFGVRPPNDNWTNALSELPFEAVGVQSWGFCYPENVTLPFWFTCSRGGKTTRMGVCTRSFMQVMCDLEHCEHLIRTHEARAGVPFDFVTRLRLDVAWEAELPVPTAFNSPMAVHVPHMNAQGGTNDKFVTGSRQAMSAYLNRTAYFARNLSYYAWVPRGRAGQPFAFDCAGNPSSTFGMRCHAKGFRDTASDCKKRNGCMISMNSERFLSFALWRANVTIVHHQAWMYCKYGFSHGWRPCTRRMREHAPCRSLECISYAARGGCQCHANTTCRGELRVCKRGRADANTTCEAKQTQRGYCTDVTRRSQLAGLVHYVAPPPPPPPPLRAPLRARLL